MALGGSGESRRVIALVAALALAADARASTDLKRDVVMAFAMCVRRRAPDRAAALLASEPDSRDEGRLAMVIATAYDACLQDRRVLSFDTGLLRGQLAELAFRDDAALRDRARRLAATAPVKPDLAQIERSAAAVAATYRETHYAQAFRAAFARCVAAASPQTVTALFDTDPASAAERAVLMKAGDTLMQCMPEGVSYHIVPAELRPYLMSNLYYRAAAGVIAGA